MKDLTILGFEYHRQQNHLEFHTDL